MTDARKELEIAEALAKVQQQRLRGEAPDLLSFRERLGDSLAEFIDLVNVDAMIDDFTEPPAPEQLPREFGTYTLQRELGQGAIGIVYEAWHKPLGRKAAVKMLKPPYDRDREARERFRDEAQNAAKVTHEHIVGIYDVSEFGGAPYYAMEVVEGRPLSALIASGDLPPIPDLCREFAGIADALERLHRVEPDGVIHRDVKPQNIMVRPDGRMKLMDFGLARVGDGVGLTQTGVAVGTPLYMPPEQMLGRRGEMDGRADVYALGATIYETIAGTPIFEPSTFEIVSKQVVVEVPPLLRTKAPDCPKALETIVKNALEKRREDRYQSAAAMRDDLLKVANGREDEAPKVHVTPLIRTARWMRSPVGLAAAASALLVVGAGLWWTSRPATLEITANVEGAEVLLAGESFGRTPLSSPIEPGSYDVVLRRPRFKDAIRRVDAAAGASLHKEFVMWPVDDDDPIAKLEMARAERVDTLGYRFERDRGLDPGASLVFVYPRGSVRTSDLDSYGFEIDLTVGLPTEGGTLEFRRGAQVLSAKPFVSDYKPGRHLEPFPSEVRDQLRVGDVVTWGLRFKGATPSAGGGKNVLATFTVVSDEATAEFARFRERLVDRGYPETISGELEVRKLWSLGLLSAALARADALADAHEDHGSLQALALFAHLRLKIKSSFRVTQLEDRLDKLPEAERKRLADTVAEEEGGTAPAEPPTRGGR